MLVASFPAGPWGTNCYVLATGDGEHCLVVDPGKDAAPAVAEVVREHHLQPVAVLLTHGHLDHVWSVVPVCGSYGVPAFLHPADLSMLADPLGAISGQTRAMLEPMTGGTLPVMEPDDVRELVDGAVLELAGLTFTVDHAPGHTPGSVMFARARDTEVPPLLLSGDVLFAGSIGRTDLPDPDKTGENAGILYDSIHRKIGPLGDQALLFPAHGAGSACGGNISERDDSTLGIERDTNPAFTKSRGEFVEDKLSLKMARPPYFEHMEEVNLLPGRPLAGPSTIPVLQPKDFQRRMREGVVIDTRSPEAFASAHVPGAYNIWLDGLPAFGGWVANCNTRIYLVADGLEAMELAVISLARIGIDTVEGFLANGIEAWRDEGLPIESFATTTASETAQWLQQGSVQVLDVRDEYEWEEKHIAGALHRYVGQLEDNFPLLSKDSDIVVHCNVGHRSGLAASILKRGGFTRIHNMLGGITAWEKLGLPLELSDEAKKEHPGEDQ